MRFDYLILLKSPPLTLLAGRAPAASSVVFVPPGLSFDFVAVCV